MIQNIMKITGMSEEDIRLQTQDEYNRGLFAMAGIRQELESDYKLYRAQKKSSKKEKIGDWTVFSTHSALMALSYVNRPESLFESHGIGDEHLIDNINNAYKTDFNTDDMEIIQYWEDFSKFLTGIGITARNGWNGKTKAPTFQSIDTRYWIPDPDGDYVTGKYSFSGFEQDMYKSELIDNGLWHEDLNIQDKNQITLDPKISDKQDGGMIYQESSKEEANPVYRVYYHFATFVGEKGTTLGMVITGNSNNLVLGANTIKTMPFSFKYWNPDGTITGMRVTKITGDIQRVKAEITNLRLDKSKAELYPMYIRNSRVIPNKSDLEFGFNKVIDANPLEGESLRNALTPLQKDFRSDYSFQIENSLDGTIQSTTAVNKVVQGGTPERRETATTVDEMMGSTDTIMAFRAKIESWGEKQRLRLYINGLREDLKDGDKKKINVLTSYGLVPRYITKKDLALDDNVTFKIITKTESDKDKDKLRLAYGTAIGMIQTLPLTESAKKYLYRDYFETIGLDKEKAERVVDYSPDEIIAIINVSLLNQGQYLKPKPEYDPMTHLAALKSAKPGENVDIYKHSLMKLYKIKGGAIPQGEQPGGQGMGNNIAAQSMSNIANETTSLLNNK